MKDLNDKKRKLSMRAYTSPFAKYLQMLTKENRNYEVLDEEKRAVKRIIYPNKIKKK